MIELPWGDILSTGGPSTLLGVVVWMILTGRLVPRSFYREKVDEAKKWETAANETREQVKELLTYARAADKVLKSLPRGKDTDEVG
jgi:hypothetical protein